METPANDFHFRVADSRSPPGWIVCLVAVGLLDFWLAEALRPHSWNRLIFAITIFGLATVSLAWVTARVTIRRSIPQGIRPAIVMAALWIAPLAVFGTEGSAWVLLPAVPAVIAWIHVARNDPPYDSHGMFPALCASFSLQSGVVAVLADRPLIAALLICLTVAIVVWRKHEQARPLTPMRWLRTIVLSSALTAFGLIAYLPGRFGSGGSAASASDTEEYMDGRTSMGGVTNADVYRGVILWPKEEDHVTLVPPLPSMSRRLFRPNNTSPLKIPFYGAYWFFKPPQTRPPAGAITMRGDPVEKAFRSNTNALLAMEAHQNLGKLIDLACCSRIELDIRNADLRSTTVAVELILFNTSLASKPYQSLGLATLRSKPYYGVASETLTFLIPANSTLRQFDEFTVRFPRNPIRWNRSARIAIDQFLLVPR